MSTFKDILTIGESFTDTELDEIIPMDSSIIPRTWYDVNGNTIPDNDDSLMSASKVILQIDNNKITLNNNNNTWVVTNVE